MTDWEAERDNALVCIWDRERENPHDAISMKWMIFLCRAMGLIKCVGGK